MVTLPSPARTTRRSTAPDHGGDALEAGVVLSVEDVSIEYRTPGGAVRAVRNVSFVVRAGEAVALIGESGSGKTTLGLGLLRMLVRAARITSGRIRFRQTDGQVIDVARLTDRQLREFRWSQCSMVFQSAQNSLNPVLRVGDHFRDTAAAHGWKDTRAVNARSAELLKMVQLDADRVMHAYPHELSGGMRQRVSIAMSLLLEPALIILDEPTTALDILTQRAIIDVIRSLRERLSFTMLFISHDLSLAAELADHVATMYAGEVVEFAPVRESFYRPKHPYTVGLLNAVPPIAGEQFTPLTAIPGSTPDLLDLPPGCTFHPRCPYATEICHREIPPDFVVGPGHLAACFHHDRVSRQPVETGVSS
ncbi:MAG: ABC transporter ATP-binding protein [Chloroflexia bacterium]|nr:ABC transporter ATP-binding protein [Chloroflexia bacterium]MDQ3513489.1 ABC transporter ATP-binding protein [Chloroflexota bacterium]